MCCSLFGLVATRYGTFPCIVPFLVLLLCLVNPVRHCDHLVGEEIAGCFAFLWLMLVYCLVFVVSSSLCHRLVMFCDCGSSLISNTVDTHYLEVQGTFRNTSRYPYTTFQISRLEEETGTRFSLRDKRLFEIN